MYYPVEARKDDIIRSVNQNPVTIISAETGAGNYGTCYDIKCSFNCGMCSWQDVV